jgi:hypothetical protein
MTPTARTQGLLVEQLGDETVVYDTSNDHAHNLDAQASAIFAAADGTRTAAQIAARCNLTLETVEHTLAELADRDLLTPTGLRPSRLLPPQRRQLQYQHRMLQRHLQRRNLHLAATSVRSRMSYGEARQGDVWSA